MAFRQTFYKVTGPKRTSLIEPHRCAQCRSVAQCQWVCLPIKKLLIMSQESKQLRNSQPVTQGFIFMQMTLLFLFYGPFHDHASNLWAIYNLPSAYSSKDLCF